MLKMEVLLKDKEQKVLEKFGKLELTAAQVYLFLSNKMQILGYFGASKFFLNEHNSEKEHYKKLVDYCNNLNYCLNVPELETINFDISSLKEALEVAYKMESDLLSVYEKDAENLELSLKVRLLLQDFTSHQVSAVGEYGDLISRSLLATDQIVFDQEFSK